MAFAPARVAPAVAQRLQIPVQVLLYVGLFIFAQYLAVSYTHLQRVEQRPAWQRAIERGGPFTLPGA